MDGELYLDSIELSHHKDFILGEKYTAQRLQDNFDSVKRMLPDEAASNRDVMRQFQRLSEKLDMLVRFYSSLHGALDDIHVDAEIVSRKIDLLFSDYMERVSGLHIFNTDLI